MTAASDPDPDVTIREARPADAEAVAVFTRNTWGERTDDYIPRVFSDWADADDPDSETFVATLSPDAVGIDGLDGRENGDTLVEDDGNSAAESSEPEAVVGCIRGALLSEWEGWAQGIRVDPAARGFGVGTALSTAVLDWVRERGATVCRNMVFSWNVAGLGQSRAVGFEPGTEFRFAEPEPSAAGLAVDSIGDPDPNAVWAFWTDSDAHDRLRGLVLDDGEAWACSKLTRERLRIAAAEERLLAVHGAREPNSVKRTNTLAGFAIRTRISQSPSDDRDRIAVYGVAAWRDVDAAGELYQSIAADAAAVDADAARVLIPETVEHVSDTAANRVLTSDEPDFVMSADLTGTNTIDRCE